MLSIGGSLLKCNSSAGTILEHKKNWCLTVLLYNWLFSSLFVSTAGALVLITVLGVSTSDPSSSHPTCKWRAVSKVKQCKQCELCKQCHQSTVNSKNSVQVVSTVLSPSLMVFFLNVCLCTSQWCWVKSCWSPGKKRLSVFLDCCWPITSFLYLPPCINISFLISFSLLISRFLCFCISWLFLCFIS